MRDAPARWHRISALSVLFFVVALVKNIGLQGLPGLVVLFAALGSAEAVKRGWIVTAAAALLALLVLGGILSWLRFRYRITGERILLRKGVLHREELDIDFARVQNITIREPWYMRPLGLAVLSIDTAGSRAREIVIAGIDKALAQELRGTILGAARAAAGEEGGDGHARPAAAQAGTVSAPTELLALTRGDVVIHGLTANFMLWFAIAVGALFGSEGISEAVIGWLEAKLQVTDTVAQLRSEGGSLVLALAVAGVALVILAIMPLISVIGALLRYDGYRLSVEGETYRKASGLLSRHDESIKRHKIQALVWKQNAAGRLFGRIALQLRQASAGSELEQGQLASGMKSAFLVPALRPAQATELSAEFLPGCAPGQADYSPVDRARFMKMHLAAPLLPLSLVVIAPSIVVNWAFALLPLLAAGPLALIAHQRWKRHGYGVAGEFGFVRSGFIGAQHTLFPLFKIQRVDIRQTPVQHRRGLAHLTIHLASHSLRVPYIPLEHAIAFRDLALYHAESTDRPWY